MKKIFTRLLSIFTAILVFTFIGCTDKSDNGNVAIDQWDCFDSFVSYTQYEYLDAAPSDWSRNRITNSYGEVQSNCWGFVGNFGDVNIKDMTSHSDLDFYSQLRISRKTNEKTIIMTKLAISIFAEADCEMIFSLSIKGDKIPRASVTVSAVANTETDLLFEQFAEYKWEGNSTKGILITLENPNAIGNIKYGFSNLRITLKADE